MEEPGKRRLRNAGVAAVAAGYFFAFAVPLPRELALHPAWAVSLGAQPAALPPATGAFPAPEAEALPFRLGSRFGYVSPEGRLLFVAPVPWGVALSSRSWIAYDRVPEKLELRDPDGAAIGTIGEPGYPFFDAERLFVLAPGQFGVAELSLAGTVIWKRDFASLVTAFDANADFSVFGLLDGSLVGLGRGGEELLSFAPGGSRLPGVYGSALSPDGRFIGAVTGIDPQRLILLERRTSSYRVSRHRDLGSDYRRPVAMAFTADGRYLLFERPGGAGILAPAGGKEAFLEGRSFSSFGTAFPDWGLLAVIEDGDSTALVLVLPSGKRVVTAAFDARETFARGSGDALFIGAGSPDSPEASVFRVNLREE